ncbi:MAG: hypothetical protein N4A53_02720 [Pelagimonas sp.]|jgi:hypothetical protein|nr:hypothetical protein [Pelagimonas sp.]
MEVLMLNTSDDPKHLLKQGYSGSWSLKATRAIACDYVVICQLGTGKAVLVAELGGIMKAGNRRFDVHFGEAALVEYQDIWTRKSKNPVGYIDVSELPFDPRKTEFGNRSDHRPQV